MEEIELKRLIDDLHTAHFFLNRAMDLLEEKGELSLSNEVILCKCRINEIIKEINEKEG